MPIYSVQVERHVLGGLIRNPEIFFDISKFISEKDFFNDVHSTIFSCIKDELNKNNKIDKVLLAQKIKNLGISFKDEIDIFSYIDALALTQINSQGTINACKELSKLKVRRELMETAENVKKYVKENAEENIDAIVSKVDGIYNNKISQYYIEGEPINLFEELESIIEEIGNNPRDETGLKTPYNNFNNLYGGLKQGNIYSIVSRPGQGKSTWLNDIGYKTSNVSNKNTKALILDTEMSTLDTQMRLVASISGVPLWFIETGNWRKNPEMIQKVRDAWPKVKNMTHYHYHVANKNIDEISSIIRRWYYTKVGRVNQAVIVYDYIKLTGEKVGQNWAEHQAIGDKIDKLKRISEEIKCPVITAMQLNRTGENFNRNANQVTDDSSAIALSDRMQWFASFVGIFRRKTQDEIQVDGEQFGTHKLIAIKTRFQGKDGAGHHDLVRRRVGENEFKYFNNYINFEVNNFNVEERGTLREIVDAENERLDFDQEGQSEDGELL
jgi:replicative DNA helicase